MVIRGKIISYWINQVENLTKYFVNLKIEKRYKEQVSTYIDVDS